MIVATFSSVFLFILIFWLEKRKDTMRHTENSEGYRNLKSSFWNNTKTRRTIDYKKESEEARRHFASLRDS